jgi:hypothetical protein
MKLSHYSKKPITMDMLFDVKEQKTHDCIKPTGLWLSCDGPQDWASWCAAEQFNLGSYLIKQRVELRPDVTVDAHDKARIHGSILLLSAPRDLDVFMARFGKAMYEGGRREWIDWPEVALHYDGLIINPYIYARRMQMIWYYGWDCASGCIWRPNRTIKSIGEAEPSGLSNIVLTDEGKA